jgi:hypothetical protein
LSLNPFEGVLSSSIVDDGVVGEFAVDEEEDGGVVDASPVVGDS